MHRTTLKELSGALATLNLPRDHVVMVHSGLFKLGIIEGGVAGVYECLAETLGNDATIVMPAFSFSYATTRIWRARETASQTGALCEYFRKNVATTRSTHPFHSVCAVGPLAHEITSGVSRSSFGPQSAFQKLYDMEAINLSVGTEFVGGATFLHMGEERMEVPYRFMKAFPGEVWDWDGHRVEQEFDMFARKITDSYEYDNVWEGCWDDLNDRGMFKVTHLKGAMIAQSNVKETLDTFMGFLKHDPFYCARKFPIQNAS